MNDQTPAPSSDPFARRLYIAFCCASALFLILIVLVATMMII